MATAIQLGLVPGFALQDGDLLARLLSGAFSGGTFGLGNTVNDNVDITNSGDNTVIGAQQITASVTIITTATPTGNSVQLPEILPSTLVRIYNDSTETIYVFPPTGQSIDGAPNNEAVWLSGGARCDYMFMGYVVVAGVGYQGWKSDLLGSPSA